MAAPAPFRPDPPPAPAISPRRVHLARLMSIWRSAGWPCRDEVELDLVAAGWVATARSDSGHETLRLTSSGVRLLAEARQRNQRAASAHDRLAERMARQLMLAGRVVWRELSLRSRFDAATEDAAAPVGPANFEGLWSAGTGVDAEPGTPAPRKAAWRIARPDVFSVRNTSVEAYLHPMVHEVKASRADLLSDLRHAAKRASYRWLSCETYYVFPAGVAEPAEIPEVFGIWLLHDGDAEHGRLELARPARHADCKLPFSVWMALARSAPVPWTGEAAQGELGDAASDDGACGADPANPV